MNFQSAVTNHQQMEGLKTGLVSPPNVQEKTVQTCFVLKTFLLQKDYLKFMHFYAIKFLKNYKHNHVKLA